METEGIERTIPVVGSSRPRRLVGWLLIGVGVITPLLLLPVFRFLAEPSRAPLVAQRMLEFAPLWGGVVVLMIAAGAVLLRVGRIGIAAVAVLALVWLTGTVMSRPFSPSKTVTSPAGDLALRVRPLPLATGWDREVSLEQRRGMWSQRVVLGCLTGQQQLSVAWVSDDEVRLTVLEDGNPLGPSVTYMALYGSDMMFGMPSQAAGLQSC